MIKLYSQQGVTLRNPAGIREPETVKNPFIKILDKTAETTAKLSKQNYALGRAQLITDVLDNAYQNAPDNPEQFNELVKSGFEKGLAGLSDTTKKDIYATADDKIKALQIKVGKNLNAKLDAENTNLILDRADKILNSEGGVLSLNKQIADGIISGESRDELDKYINIQNQNKAQLEALAKAKNLKGSYIINSKEIRKAINEGEYNMYDELVEGLRGLDYEGLKSFDENTFQDRERFLKKTGLTSKTYDQLSKNIKQMRKDLNAADQREIKSARNFNVLQYVTSLNPEYLTQNKAEILKMENGKDLYKRLEGLQKGTGTVNPALVTDEDANFINNFNALTRVINSQNDGSEDYDSKLMADIITAQESVNAYRKKYGASEETVDAINEILINSAADQLYADSMKINENNALYKIVNNINEKAEEKSYKPRFTGFGLPGIALDYAISTVGSWLDPEQRKIILNEPDYDGMKHIAHDTILAMNSVARQLRQPGLSQEDKETIFNQVKAIEAEGNKAIIRRKYRHIIPEAEMQRLESENAQGKTALFKFHGSMVGFEGFTDDDIIIKTNM